MSDSKNTISSSELSMLLLGSSTALPITGAQKEWTDVMGKSRPNSYLQPWERSGRGLNTVEASQLLKEQTLGSHPKNKPSVSTTRYRKTEVKGGRGEVIRNYHMLLNDLPKKNDTSENKVDALGISKDASFLNNAAVGMGFEDVHLSGMDMRREKSFLGKRPYSDDSDPSHSSDDDNDDESSQSLFTAKKMSASDGDSRSDEVDARRNRARMKSFQRRGEALTNSTRQGLHLNETSKIVNAQAGSKSSQSDSSDSTDNSSDTDSSTIFSTSEDEVTNNFAIAHQSSKPIFVPKSQRLSAAEIRVKEKGESDILDFAFHLSRIEELNHVIEIIPMFFSFTEAGDLARLKQTKKELEIQKSRHLLATMVANDLSGDRFSFINDGCLGEFSEIGGNLLPPPDDDDNDEECATKTRDEWEVRELMRIMREVEEKIKVTTEGKDQCRLEVRNNESHEFSDKWNTTRGKHQGNYLQRYYHRGAFYLDEDTLNEAGPSDIRHKASEYAVAATLEDKVDKSKLPQVMQVKKFGFSGYSTKYKGLKMEDTTDKSIRHVSIKKDGTASR